MIAPPQECCGLPMISNGLYQGARNKARRNVDVLAEYARQGYRIVGTSTSCTHTLKAEYEEMLDVRDEDAHAVSQATWDICEFLLDLHEQGRLDTGFGRLDEELPYHAPCQLRSHGIGLPAMDLFALVPGLRAVDMDHDCCGIAGTYGLKKEKYDIAMRVGDAAVPEDRGERRRRDRLRLRDVPLADRVGDEPTVAAPGRDPRRGVRGRRRNARRATARTLGRMRVLVVGAGAVGSFLGWAVAAGGGETTLVRRAFDGTPGARTPLRLVRPDGTEAPVDVGVVRSVADAPAPDLVIVAVRQYDLPAALDSLAVLPDVALLTAQNGVGAEEAAAAARPAGTLLAASVTASVEREPDGSVRWLRRGGVALAPVRGDAAALIEGLSTTFRAAGVRCRRTP